MVSRRSFPLSLFPCFALGWFSRLRHAPVSISKGKLTFDLALMSRANKIKINFSHLFNSSGFILMFCYIIYELSRWPESIKCDDSTYLEKNQHSCSKKPSYNNNNSELTRTLLDFNRPKNILFYWWQQREPKTKKKSAPVMSKRDSLIIMI